MNTLSQIQQRFVAAVLQHEPATLATLLAGDIQRSAARATIYINNHHIGLRTALAAVYPVLQRLLGAACFELLARRYVALQPKLSGNICDFGGSLSDLIAETDGLLELPYLADVARLEWLRHQVFHAADHESALESEQLLSLSSLAELDDSALARLRLRLHASAQLFQSRWPVLDIWQSNHELELPAASRASAALPISLDAGGVQCLVLRTGVALRHTLLGAPEFAFLQALAFHPVCVAADIALHADRHFNLPATLVRWLPRLRAARRDTP